jgi:hypothetical protein
VKCSERSNAAGFPSGGKGHSELENGRFIHL